MKEGRWLLIISIAVLVLSFLPLHLFLPELVLMAGSFDLAPGSVSGPSMFVPLNSVVILDYNVGGSENNVYFYLTDASGKRVFDTGRLQNEYHLVWTSTGFSTYKFNFDNTISLANHKQVTYRLRVYNYSTIFLFLGIALVVVAVLQIIREERSASKLKN